MVGFLLTCICLGMYLLPSIIAAIRKHRNFGALLALNIFLGWTVFGWVGALVWSLIRQTPIIVQGPVVEGTVQ